MEIEIYLRPLDLKLLVLPEYKILSDTVVGGYGCHKYKLIVNSEDVSLWQDISYKNLEFYIPSSIRINEIEENELLKMMESWCELKLGKVLLNTNYIIMKVLSEDGLYFYPMYDNDKVYLSEKEHEKYTYDFTPLIGYGLIGTTLLHLVAAQQYMFPEFIFYDEFVLYNMNYLLDNGYTRNDINNKLDDVNNLVQGLLYEGTVAIGCSQLYDYIYTIRDLKPELSVKHIKTMRTRVITDTEKEAYSFMLVTHSDIKGETLYQWCISNCYYLATGHDGIINYVSSPNANITPNIIYGY